MKALNLLLSAACKLRDRFQSRKKRSCGWVTLAFAVLLCAPLHAATYYVASSSSTPAGNDSAAGSIAAPWLTLSRALDPSHAGNKIACGDTVIIVADGNYVAGASTIPYFSGCVTVTTVQSSALASFLPTGFRTIPANDSANYGKLKLTAQGILAQVEGHGEGACLISSLSGNTFTLGFCLSSWANVGNGTQVAMQLSSEGNISVTDISSNLTILQWYYIINCSSCGASGGTFQLAATSGGTAITTTCSGGCIVGALNIVQPIQVNTSTSTLTSPDAFVAMGNNTPVYLSATGLQLGQLTTPATALPAPLQFDTQYWMVNVSGRQFQLSATMGGSPITLTTVGAGPFQMSDARVPAYWAFRGLELKQAAGSGQGIFAMMLGAGNESSALGTVHDIEVDRTWIHEDSSDEASPTGLAKGIVDNGRNINIHDNWIAGASNGESQAIAGWNTPGPTLVTNNFLEGAGENTLLGGAHGTAGIPNANVTFTGNYYYKPPAWRLDCSTNDCVSTGGPMGNPSGACWYDATTDPKHPGGQWYLDTNSGQYSHCTSGGTWATTGSTPPAKYTIKTMAEHKNGRALTYIGNVFKYNWGNQQAGQAFNMGQQQGSGPGMANDTIVITYNKIDHVLEMGNLFSESCLITTAIQCETALLPHNFTIANNSAIQEQAACGVPSVGSGGGCPAHMFGMAHSGYPPINFAFDQNTIVSVPDGLSSSFPWDASATFWQPTSGLQFDNWSYTNSIIGYDFEDGAHSCGAVFSTNFTHTTVNRIANPNATCMAYSSVGATNTFTNWSPQATNAGVGFVDLANGDLHLTSMSPYSAANGSATLLSANGTDLGADIDAIAAKSSGAVLGTPTWAVQEGFTVTPLATVATVTYTRPGTTACSLTLYDHPARISANEDADTNTSGKKLDTRTGNTVVGANVTFNLGFNSALTPNTQYWYKLSCVAADMSTWLLAGDSFTTLPAAPLSPRRSGAARNFGGAR